MSETKPLLAEVECGDVFTTDRPGVTVVILYLFEDDSDFPFLGVAQGGELEFEDRWNATGESMGCGLNLVQRLSLVRCPSCSASLVECKVCDAMWCLDCQPNPLRCPVCGRYPRDRS